MLYKITNFTSNYLLIPLKNNTTSKLSSNMNSLNIQNVSDVVSFSGNSINTDNFYSIFLDEYYRVYGNIPLEDTLKNVINTANELNHGKEKKIFNFPNMYNYVIGYRYNKPLDEMGELHACKNLLLPKYYIGQPIIEDNNGTVLIMKRVKGVPNSVDNRDSVLSSISSNNCVTKEKSKNYIQKLRLLKNFPQESYDDFAEELVYINENSDLIDYMNPNNLLVDVENKKFNLIDMVDMVDFSDYCKNNNVPKSLIFFTKGLKNIVFNNLKTAGLYPLCSFLLDSKLQPYFLDNLNPKEKAEVKQISRDVINKCKIALIHCGYDVKKETSSKTKFIFKITDIVTGTPYSRRYQEFLDTYDLK